MYSSSASLSASPRSRRASPVQPTAPRIAHSASSRKSARCAEVGKQVRVRIHVHLHHEDGGGDEQHARDRVERRVQVLDGVVHPAPEVAGGDARRDAERQQHERGERADHQARADALQRLVEDVAAHLVGAEHVIAHGEGGGRAREREDPAERRGSGAPGHLRPAPRERAPAGEHREPPQHGGAGQARERAQRDVPAPVGLVLQVRAAVRQARELARGRAVGAFHGLLLEEPRGERRRVGLLDPRAQRREQRVERRAHLHRVGRRRAGILRRQRRPVMQRIEQPREHE
jgi:hypothetical protein